MNDTFSKSGFLRTSRSFPEDIHQLTVEINTAYVDIARSVNNRVIGFFPVNRSIETGESWRITQNKPQTGYRQVYKWDDSNLTITHGIQFSSLTNFVRIWGTFLDGSGNYETLPYVDVLNVTNQINVKITPTQIIITKGAGAPPTCKNGLVIVEWIGNA